MKKYALLSVLWMIVAGGSISHAKDPLTWNQGQLLLTNGAQFEGELNYNWKAEIVQLRQGNTIKAYSAHQVDAFVFFDLQQNVLRKFVAVEYPVKRALLRKLFVEEFVKGPMTVYRRLRHVREPIKVSNPSALGNDQELVGDVDSFVYFVHEGDQVTNLDDFSRTIWPKMQEEFGNELKQYALSQGLDLHDTTMRLLLINQYNALKTKSGQGDTAQPTKLSASE